MKPVKQTKHHDPDNGVCGNCFVACIASMLEQPLSSVPTFEVLMGSPYVWQAFSVWITQQGYRTQLYTEAPQGYSIAMGITNEKDPLNTVDGFGRHCCIARNGKIIHNPGRARLEKVEQYMTLEKLG